MKWMWIEVPTKRRRSIPDRIDLVCNVITVIAAIYFGALVVHAALAGRFVLEVSR